MRTTVTLILRLVEKIAEAILSVISKASNSLNRESD